MSYDVYLESDVGNPLALDEPFQEGGTQVMGGTRECWLNITYNYAEVFGGLVRNLNGRKAADTIAELKQFVGQHPNAKPYSRDYWAPTPGNAKVAIERLITFAEKYPNGIWRVS